MSSVPRGAGVRDNVRVEAIVEAQGVWEPIEPTEGKTVNARKDKVAMALIFQMLPEDLLLQVATKKTVIEAWESLKTRFVGADRVKTARMQTLRSEFEGMHIGGDTLEAYMGKLSGMAAKYSSLGATLDDETLVKKLFDSLPSEYYPVITRIEQFSDLGSMPFEEAVERLKAFEKCTQIGKPISLGESQLLLTEAQWRERDGRRNCDRCGRNRNDNNNNVKGSGIRNDRDKSHIKCYKYGRMRQYTSECRSKLDKAEANLTLLEEETTLPQTEDQEPILLFSEVDTELV
ncbi:uncharacterized protein LOC127251233 [Andrographis paniculata]|uniref:uncharacterized protein LOC127251233 n=1 Tax=Andrographis paniculata TaxID=175694 RepID=UPI0021E8DA10|nr:uncharacterized protein LOC127251233 [Andrographis paniculata]